MNKMKAFGEDAKKIILILYRFTVQTKEKIIFIIFLQPISGRVAPKSIHEHNM